MLKGRRISIDLRLNAFMIQLPNDLLNASSSIRARARSLHPGAIEAVVRARTAITNVRLMESSPLLITHFTRSFLQQIKIELTRLAIFIQASPDRAHPNTQNH